MQPVILLVEDEPHVRAGTQQFLCQRGFMVLAVASGEEALEKFTRADVIILDIMLPGGSGMQLLDELKAMKKKHSVIIVSAKDSVDDKVLGLEKGADDYLAKPFHLSELLARVKSIIRRKNQQGEEVIQLKNVCLYPETRTVKVGDVLLNLNRKEYDLLYYFIIRPERLVEKTTLAEAVWGDYIDQVDSLDFIYSQIKNLRKKLKTAQAEIDFQAVYGIGYKLV